MKQWTGFTGMTLEKTERAARDRKSSVMQAVYPGWLRNRIAYWVLQLTLLSNIKLHIFQLVCGPLSVMLFTALICDFIFCWWIWHTSDWFLCVLELLLYNWTVIVFIKTTVAYVFNSYNCFIIDLKQQRTGCMTIGYLLRIFRIESLLFVSTGN